MALAQVGNAAGEVDPVVETIRRRAAALAPQRLARHPDDDALLDAIRAGLTPGDPVARLLAGWAVVPAQAVAPPATRP